MKTAMEEEGMGDERNSQQLNFSSAKVYYALMIELNRK